MSGIERYRARMHMTGETPRRDDLNRETDVLRRKIGDTLSYQEMVVWDCANGYDIDDPERERFQRRQKFAVIASDNLNEKYLYTYPGETVEHGSLILWKDHFWLITEHDANDTVYTKNMMLQCNHLLKWVDDDDNVHRQWCVIEDSTKYLTGEYEDKHFIVTRGDQRVYMSLARNPMTVAFGREQRFLIDDEDAPVKIAYGLSKPLKLGWTFGGKGVYKFVLLETQANEYDNHELGIADYYRHFPKPGQDEAKDNTPKPDREGWL